MKSTLNSSNHLAAWALAVSIISAFFTIAWSVYTYFKLLPLQQANVVFSESDIQIKSSNGSDEIMPIITNIGGSPAQNVRFRIYGASVDNEHLPDGRSVETVFDDKLVSDLQPKISTKFGRLLASYSKPQKMALIFHLQYTDTLSGKSKDKFFFFQFTEGISIIGSLVKSDYVGIYDKLVNAFKIDPTINKDLQMANFLEEHSSSSFEF